jgi:hypothetical protein
VVPVKGRVPRDRVWRCSGAEGAQRISRKEVSDYSVERRSIPLLEGSQDLPVRVSDKGGMKMKTSGRLGMLETDTATFLFSY